MAEGAGVIALIATITPRTATQDRANHIVLSILGPKSLPVETRAHPRNRWRINT